MKTNKASTRKTKSIPPPKDSSTNVAEPKGKERKEDNKRILDQGKSSFNLELLTSQKRQSYELHLHDLVSCSFLNNAIDNNVYLVHYSL